MRFTLIDKITSLEPGKSITAIKNLSLAEEYLADHFPGFPVMPGVLMLESLVQAGAWLIRATEDFAYSTILLKQAKAVKFTSFVSPGKTLTVSLEVQNSQGNEWTFKGSGSVDGTSTVVVPPGDFRQLAFSPDGTRVAFLRTNARRDLELVVADAQLRNQVVLAKGGSLGDPSHVGWTPDSRRVVVDEGTTLYAYDLAPNATPTVAVEAESSARAE